MEHLLLQLEVTGNSPGNMRVKFVGKGHDIAKMIATAMQNGTSDIQSMFITGVFEWFISKNVSFEELKHIYDQYKKM